jgi:hypothetical protein
MVWMVKGCCLASVSDIAGICACHLSANITRIVFGGKSIFEPDCSCGVCFYCVSVEML